MKRICAWCKKDMTPDITSEMPITHTICNACKISVIYKHIPLQDVLERLVQPILVVNHEGIVDSANGQQGKCWEKSLKTYRESLAGMLWNVLIPSFPKAVEKQNTAQAVLSAIQ